MRVFLHLRWWLGLASNAAVCRNFVSEKWLADLSNASAVELLAQSILRMRVFPRLTIGLTYGINSEVTG